MALDYASIMKAGQGLVPDLQEQMFMAEQDRALVDQRRANAAVNQFNLQQKQAQSVRQADFQREVSEAVASGDPRRISALMVKYPEFADQIKPGWDAYSKEGKARNMTQLGTVYVRAQNGDYGGAADMLQARYDADKAAGQADEETPQLIAALRSGDPMQQKIALGTLGMYMAAAEPDKFGEVYGKLNPSDAKTTVQKEYEWRTQLYGKAAADEWLATQDEQIVTVVPGGSAYRKSDLVTGGSTTAPMPTQPAPAQQPRGGDPADPRQGVPAPQLGPNGMPTILSRAQYNATVQSMGKEKTHAWMQRNGVIVTEDGGPPRIKTKQQYDRLPSGTQYVAPDGSMRRKP